MQHNIYYRTFCSCKVLLGEEQKRSKKGFLWLTFSAFCGTMWIAPRGKELGSKNDARYEVFVCCSFCGYLLMWVSYFPFAAASELALNIENRWKIGEFRPLAAKKMSCDGFIICSKFCFSRKNCSNYLFCGLRSLKRTVAFALKDCKLVQEEKNLAQVLFGLRSVYLLHHWRESVFRRFRLLKSWNVL